MILRPAREADYVRIEAIWQQVHTLHVSLRPDAYAPRDPALPPERFQELLASETSLSLTWMGAFRAFSFSPPDASSASARAAAPSSSST